MSFRLKTILGIALIEAILLTILIVSGLYYLSSSNEQQLMQRADTTAKLVATMTGDSVVALDLATLDALVDQTTRNPDIVYIRIRNAKGIALSEGGNRAALSAPFIQDKSIQDVGDQRLDVSASIIVAGNKFGTVELGISTEKLQTTLSDAFKWMAGIALSEMLLVAVMGLILGTYLTRQLQLIRKGAKRVAAGEFGHLIPISGSDELADTARSFNRMSHSLKEYAEIAEDARRRAEAGRALAESTLHDALDSMRDGVLIVGPDGKVVLANAAYRNTYDIEERQISDLNSIINSQADMSEKNNEDFIKQRVERLEAPQDYPRWEDNLASGRHLLVAQHPMSRGGVVVVETDVTELYTALEENKKLQLELVQKHKTEALGTLAGGIAHEVNTPIQYISDNVSFLAEGVADMFGMIDELAESDDGQKNVEEILNQKIEEIDLPFLRDEMPTALTEMSKGLQQVRDLIATFKQISAPASEMNEFVDLGQALQSIVEISQSDWKDVADVQVEIKENMPDVPCNLSQINQAMHSLIANAVHAIEDCRDERKGQIKVSLSSDEDKARIDITDNGCGIPAENMERIFDTLFTTKEPGRGTGNGLALCRTIVERGHEGHIRCESEVGKGTVFRITLPLTITNENSAGESLAEAV